jgi:hypothetical protein
VAAARVTRRAGGALECEAELLVVRLAEVSVGRRRLAGVVGEDHLLDHAVPRAVDTRGGEVGRADRAARPREDT